MATASDQVKKLNGDKELYDSLISRLSNGEILEDYELAFLIALKNIFSGNMSATATGAGGLQ